MLFADDICLQGESKEKIKEQLDVWVRISKQYGFVFSEEKNEVNGLEK